MPNFYISASVKINLEKYIFKPCPCLLIRFKPDPLMVEPSGTPRKIPPLRIEPRRMADLEIKSNYTVS